MALKLSARQQAQVAFLERLPPKIQKLNATIEQMAGGQADDVTIRQLVRTCDEMKAGASQLGINALADASGGMASMGRRGGAMQVKVRGLRDLLASVKHSFDAAMKKATEPDGDHQSGE
jgi:chemotaxis protein histidine kinase CheA